jgi:hypothetical protein
MSHKIFNNVRIFLLITLTLILIVDLIPVYRLDSKVHPDKHMISRFVLAEFKKLSRRLLALSRT